MHRVIILVLAILTALPIFIRNREKPAKYAAPAVFSVYTSQSKIYVLISGSVKYPGVYLISANVLTSAAINMAMVDANEYRIIPSSCSERSVMVGDHLKLVLKNDGSGEIKCDTMSSSERLLLGIPLDINSMNLADFESLPGIGPVMAQRIIDYRQKNGGKMKYEELLFVEGIGEKKLKALAKYF